jgi:hypothetical protein
MVAAFLNAAVSLVYCSLVTTVCVENDSNSPMLCAILAADCFGTAQQAATTTATPFSKCSQLCCCCCNDADYVFVCKSISDSTVTMCVILRAEKTVGPDDVGHTTTTTTTTTLDQEDLVSDVRKALCVQEENCVVSPPPKWAIECACMHEKQN